MDDKKINITVDGREISADKGQMLIEVTDKNDIYIPRFCYHKKLTVAANCRMCLVDVEKAPKPLPACSTPVMDGMVVRTQSKLAIDAQKSVMEFLLINHPLDCPICDQGGECELQDLAMGYGSDVSRYQERKRVVVDKNIGPLIQTDLTRCIHCTRCVRFGEEIAGLRELGATGRGENMEIGTYIEKSVTSELSGNVIDLCPVGALTSKPFRYSARTWELVQRNTVAPHDSVGSNIHLHVKGDTVKRVVPAENEAINETWISDRDRFSYEAINCDDRLHYPMVKVDGVWQQVEWQEALDFIQKELGAIIDDDPSQFGALVSPSLTLEELYLSQKLLRGLGSNNIDCRLKQIDFSEQASTPLFPWLGQSIVDFEENQAVFLIGSNVRKDQPIINHRLRKAVVNGASVMVLNPVDYDFNFSLHCKSIVAPNDMVSELASVLRAAVKLSNKNIDSSIKKLITGVSIGETHKEIAQQLFNSENTIILLGNLSTTHPQFTLLRTLAGVISKLTRSKLGYLSESVNTSGGWLAGALPHRLAGGADCSKIGLNSSEIIAKKLKAYLLVSVEPELDCWDTNAAHQAMKNADLVIMFSAFQSKSVKDYANVLLPIATYAENSGAYINNEGVTQRFSNAVPPQCEALPAWKALKNTANCLGVDGFNYESSDVIYDEVINIIDEIKRDNYQDWSTNVTSLPKVRGLQRITETPMNMIDPLTRRATSLQNTRDVSDGSIHINTSLANKNKLSEVDMALVYQAEKEVQMTVEIDDRVPDNCVLIQSSHPSQIELGGAFGSIKIKRSKA